METEQLTAADKEVRAIATDIISLAKAQHIAGHPPLSVLLSALLSVNASVLSALDERDKRTARLTLAAFAEGHFDD